MVAAASLLTLPDEIFYQICTEILGGEAALRTPIKELSSYSYHFDAVGRQHLPAFYACHRLRSVLRDILYSRQIYEALVEAPGTDCILSVQLDHQFRFLKAYGKDICNWKIHVRFGPTQEFPHSYRNLTKAETAKVCCDQLRELVNFIVVGRTSSIRQLRVSAEFDVLHPVWILPRGTDDVGVGEVIIRGILKTLKVSNERINSARMSFPPRGGCGDTNIVVAVWLQDGFTLGEDIQ